jgi:N-glycosylase/DNA lyase
MTAEISLPTPVGFNFDACLQSHGWVQLSPFFVTDDGLGAVLKSGSSVVSVHISSKREGALIVRSTSELANGADVEKAIGHILRIDEDLSEFYTKTDGANGLEWVRNRGAGRLLRGATVWEDLVKTLCTTNCSWGLTLKMVSNLVEKLGDADEIGNRAFPTPEAMASVDEAFYREEIRAGYRSPYFVELAKRAANGDLEIESWLTSPLATQDLQKVIKSVKGVGDYAAENLLKLLGRYDGLALDSWLRAQYYKKYEGGKPCPDAKIERHYSAFGDWKGLAIWCDMTQEWHLKGRDEVSGV